MYESSDIVRYLYRTYGGGADPPAYLIPSTIISGWVPTLIRTGRGIRLLSIQAPTPLSPCHYQVAAGLFDFALQRLTGSAEMLQACPGGVRQWMRRLPLPWSSGTMMGTSLHAWLGRRCASLSFRISRGQLPR